MRARVRPLVAGALAVSALGWSACEPLDLALFPVSAPDASAPAPIDVPPPRADGTADAGSDAGAVPPPPPSPCLPGASACEACVSASACSGADVCHPASGECVPACASGAPQCPGAFVCSPLQVCVECTEDPQCSRVDDEPRCDTLRGACVECLGNEDCTDDPFERPVCLPGGICGCASNADCSGGAICELDEGHCEIEDD